MKYLVLAFSVLAVRSVMGAGCPGDGLCSLNGVCTAGACQCDDGWMLGPDEDCSRLDLLPAPSDVSFHGLDENKSSWGGSVLRLPDAAGKPQWSMFAAEMTHDCTLRHWTTNSEVVFAVSETATGPYKEQFQIIPPWAHNPEAILTADGEVAVFTLGNGVEPNSWGPEARCEPGEPCAPGGSCPPPPPVPNAPTRPLPPCRPANGKTPATPCPKGNSSMHFLIHHAPKDGYTDRKNWQAYNATILDFPDVFRLNNGGNWNPAPVALPDGRVRVMVHTGYAGFLGDNQTLGGWSGEVIMEAASWRGPYRIITSRDITSCTKCEEDPFMWVDHRNHWHALYHRMFDNSTACEGYFKWNTPACPFRPQAECRWSGGHSYSADGIHWSPISRAYNTTVHLQDGGAVSFVSRERPKLVMGDDGRPAFLSNAVQPPQAGAGADAGVTHTLIVPLNVKQNREL